MSRTKSHTDIEAIKESVRVTELAMRAAILYLQNTGAPTAENVKAEIDRVLEDHDFESPEGRIVAGGLPSYEPHFMGEGVLQPGQPIVIDIYPRSRISGWYADMTRTVCIGEPTIALEDMYHAVKLVHENAGIQLRPGATCDEIDASITQQFAELGYQTGGAGSEFTFAEGFVHSIGHGLRQAVHEEPFFGKERGYVLQVGDVITIEPGLYYKNIGGVRLEDLFVITESGYEQLTTLSTSLRLQDW